MYRSQIFQINDDLKRTKKAIIAIGCSFVQGQGAVNNDLYVDYQWKYQEGKPLEIEASGNEISTILKKYPLVYEHSTGKLDFTFMEYENAFVNVLCKKYFNGKYTPINLGIRGCGNRGSIKELYFYPELDWNNIDETIVIYVPSGLERFDFIKDTATDHFRWKCMWPFYENLPKDDVRLLSEGYAKVLSSLKFEVLEQLAHVQELVTWCKLKNAKLIVTPGFDRRYNKEYFHNCIQLAITRNQDDSFNKSSENQNKEKSPLINLFPWEDMFSPNGYKTFADLVISNENIADKTDHYFQFLGIGSENRWITPCSHPSAKGHDQFAKSLYEHIQYEFDFLNRLEDLRRRDPFIYK